MRMRRQSSTLRIVAGETSPHLDVRRSVEIERISSHLIKLFSLTPPSGGSSGTWVRMPLALVVRGTTITSSAGLWLKRSTETTKHGRMPACSRPLIGLRSASQISPRDGDELTVLHHRPR
jgi:hypothetical protein